MQCITIIIVSISLLPCFAHLMLTEYLLLILFNSGHDTLNKIDEGLALKL